MLPKSLGLDSKWAFNLDRKQKEKKKLLNGCEYGNNNPSTLQFQLDKAYKDCTWPYCLNEYEYSLLGNNCNPR